MNRQAQDGNALYECFAKHLEAEHTGEFVAIGQDGTLIVSDSDIEVVRKAMERFGSGNFALRRIGHRAVWKWRGGPFAR